MNPRSTLLVLLSLAVFGCSTPLEPVSPGTGGSHSVSVSLDLNTSLLSRAVTDDLRVAKVTVSAYNGANALVGSGTLLPQGSSWAGTLNVSEVGPLRFDVVAEDAAAAALYRGSQDQTIAGKRNELVRITVTRLAALHFSSAGAESGAVDAVDQRYLPGTSVALWPNPYMGNLKKTGYSLAGWNTAADASGDTYNEGSDSILLPDHDVTLYPVWISNDFWAYVDSPTHSLVLYKSLVTLSGEVVVPRGVRVLREALERQPGITSVILPDTLQSVEPYAFMGDSGLTSVTLPDSVRSVGNYAFRQCANLTSIDFGDGVQTIGEGVCVESKALTNVRFGSSVVSIGSNAFLQLPLLTKVELPDTLTSVGTYAFYADTALSSVTFQNSPASVGSSAFGGCTALGAINLGSQLKSVGDYAFSGSGQVTDLVIPGTATVGKGAFSYCSKLTTVTVGAGVPALPERTFYYSGGLTKLTLGAGLVSIGANAFSASPAVTELNLPDSVTSIGAEAFLGWSGVSTLNLPASLESIGVSAFDGMPSVTSLTLPPHLTWVGTYAFGSSPIATLTCQSPVPPALETFRAFAAMSTFTSWINVPDYLSGDVYANASGWSLWARCIHRPPFDLSVGIE